MINYGDICKIKGDAVAAVDVITGGSPCQDLSVAGKRAGLAGERSGLYMEQIRLIKEMREHDRKRPDRRPDEPIRPRYMVWENVVGAFSSNGGADFQAVLEEAAKVVDENARIPGLAKGQKWPSAGCIMGDGYSLAYRVHDAQWHGVPQRRKRICLLCDFNGDTAPKILFELVGEAEHPEAFQAIANSGEEPRPEVQPEPEGLPGDIEKGGKAGQEAAGAASDGVGATGIHGGIEREVIAEPTIVQRRFSTVNTFDDGITPTLEAGAGEGGNNMPMVMGCDLYNQTITGEKAATVTASCDSAATSGPKVIVFEPGSASRVGNHVYEDSTGTLRANAGDNQQAVCYGIDQQGGKGMAGYGVNVSPTLASDSHGTPHAVAYGISSYDSNAMKSANPNSGIYEADTSRTLDNNGGNPACNQGGVAVVSYGLDRASFNQGKNAQFDFSVDKELAPPLIAKGPGGGTSQTVGPLCARDYKGVGNEYVEEGKCIIQHNNGQFYEN